MPAHLCKGCIINQNQGGGPKKCGTATGVSVITRSKRMPNMTGVNKPPLTNYTYESLQRALYPNKTVAEMNHLFGQPNPIADATGDGPGPLDQNIKCKTVTLNNKVTVPPNKTLYIPKCVILNILQSGTLINNNNKDDKYKGIVNRGTINNKGKIDNLNGKLDNLDGLLDNRNGSIDNTNGLILNDWDGSIIDNRNGRIDNSNGNISSQLGGKIDNRNGSIDNRNGTIIIYGEIDNTNGIIDNTNGEMWVGYGDGVGKITGNKPAGAGTIY